MNADHEALMPVFLSESEHDLDALEEGLIRLEGSPADPELIGAIFRSAHTLKGNAEALGLDPIMARAHALEGVLDAVRRGAVALTSAHVSLMLQASDALRAMIRIANDGGDLASADPLDLTDRLAAAALGRIEPRIPAPRAAAARRRRTLRVDQEALDRVLATAERLAAARSGIRGAIRRDRGSAREIEAMIEVDRLIGELGAEVARLRLVPLGPMLHAEARAARDLATSHGKRARAVVEGEDVEVDAQVAAALRDVVTHMVRNAVDHGVEPPRVRAAIGKDPMGTITLHARREGGRIVVEVRDDGAGIQRDKILLRARAMGIIAPGAAPTDAEIDQLILTPGLSTAASVSDLSGRGVGMDVVARHVAAQGGTISIASARGIGTSIAARIPVRSAAIDAGPVDCADDREGCPALRGAA